MVKVFVLLALFFSFANCADITQDPLDVKIKSFLGEKSYETNKDFINVIFEPKSSFYVKDRVNAVKVIQTLKDNGLLNLFFRSPQDFRLNFKTSGYPLFFVKIMEDTLQNLGYFRYVTTASNFDSSEFSWSINLTSEYATDPLILQNELQKSGCNIIDVEKNSLKEWTYTIDISNGYLNVPQLHTGEELKLKRSLYAHWLDISKIRSLTIKSSRRNRWYPYIAYYDASLHLLKLFKKNKIYKKLALRMPKNAKYIKISDMHTLKNVKDELVLYPSGTR
ncbi:hypothetical protein LCX93_10760 [Sulfurimonas sp. SWIR-19]|uniref:hypothetical protein n=1 Tax=Sulfurimonas sp. SWIR-19 TaxID=2878390 RepID=UPI001CF5D464|nr:hypothetical protein [Sulfurimonas sp. SWIR-19]UCM99993.1 hypothetical protein LCX93_10760 [Sulfurimonas sp. SWIR-19]